MSVVGVIGWTLLVTLLADLALFLSAAARPGLSLELVNRQTCFSLAFALATLMAARVHLPTRDAYDVLGVRATPWWMLGGGVLAGLLMQLVAQWLDGQMLKQWPMTTEEQELYTTLFSFRSTGHKVAVAIAVTLVGPISEEVFCRGVLFRSVRRSFGPLLTVVFTTASFAFLHGGNVRYTVNAALCGLALGALRLVAGSVWASLAAHVAYNTVSAVVLLSGWAKIGEPDVNLGLTWGLGGAVTLLALLAGLWQASRQSAPVQAATAADTE